MKFAIRINGAEKQLELSGGPPNCRFRWGLEAEREAQVERPEPGVYSVLMEGRSYDVTVEGAPPSVVVVIDGRRFEVEAVDPRRWSRTGGARGWEGRQNVATPMPGKVVRLLVAAGDSVTAGQGVAVVEAMKMQNELKATKAGRVISVPVTEGDTVRAGETLATIE